MATAITYNELQALYLGLLDRPANAGGEAYWYGTGTASSSSVAQNIGGYAQYYSADNGLNGVAISSSNITGEITNLYTNMLGYTPSAGDAGVAYWAGVFNTDVTQGMTAGAAIGSITDQIFNIVENLPSGSPYINEKTYMDNAITTAASYTQANANVAYNSSAYLAEGQTIITSGTPPTVFNLTTGIDNIAPVGNSEIYGVISSSLGKYTGTVNSFDTIKATGNNNTLNISVSATIFANNIDTTKSATFSSFNVTGVQSAIIQDINGLGIDTTTWTGLNTLSITDNGTTNVTASTGTKGTAVTINDASGTITANGGTTVSITTSGIGDVIVGSSSAPSGAVTVNDTGGAGAITGAITIDGGASANITSTATAVNPVKVSGVTGTTTVHQSGVTLTAANSIHGGTGATFITTGDNGTKGTTLGGTGYHQVIAGNATLTDTMSGPNTDNLTVFATGAVNINTTADSGNITVGSATQAALDPNAVTIVNETATSSGYVYGAGITNVYTNGATSVSITGAGVTTVADEGAANKLATVSLTGVQGTASLTSSVLTNVAIDDSLKSAGTKETSVIVSNSATGHTLNLSLSGDTNVLTALTDDKAGAINVTASGASNFITLTDTLNPASGLTYSFTNNGTGTMTVKPASIANGSNGDVIKVAGNGTVALGNLSADTHLTSITDAGAGAVTATISGQVTNFTGGSGANVIGVTSTATLKADINGGTGGNNTVIETSAPGNYLPALGATGLTNFQNLELGVGATGKYNTTQGSDHFTGLLINDQGTNSVIFNNVATTNQVVLAMTNTHNVTINPTNTAVATNTLHLDVNTPSGKLAVSAENVVIASENTISIDSVKNASSSANALAITDTTTANKAADATHTIDITGGGALTLTYTTSTKNAPVVPAAITTINASTSTGKVSVTGVATSTKGVTITGGSGKLTAQGTTVTANVNAKDVITVGSGGGNITLGYGGAGYESGNGATGSETINLSSGAVASTIITPADSKIGAQNVTINGFNVTTSSKTSDVITFAEGKTVVATNAVSTQSVGADKYTVSNGVITFTGADNVAQQIVDAYSVVNAAGNNVAAFQTTTGSTYVVASGTTNTVIKDNILDLKGVTGITQFGGTTAAANDIISTNVTGSAGAAYDTNASHTINDTGNSTQVIGGGAVFTSTPTTPVAVTVNNLAQSAIVTVENTNTTTASLLGSLTTTQVGAAGDNSLTLNLSSDKAASTIKIDTVTATGDNALTINATHVATASVHTIDSLVDSGNTLASLTLAGTDALNINGIQDTALHTINITDTGTVTLGGTTALNQTLSVTDKAGTAVLFLSGASDTVTLGAAVTSTIYASGKGLTLTTTAAAATVTLHDTGTNATVTMDSGNLGGNIIDAGANSHITLGTAAQTTLNTITAGASSVITLDKHVGTDAVATTITITGDTTGALSSGSYQMTTINNAADTATATHGANIIAAADGTANHATAAAINVASAATLSAALDIAAKEDGGGVGMAYVDWFQYGGNTYVFEHVGAGENAMSSTDYVVKLTGIVDLTHLAIANTTGVIHL